MKSRVGFQVGYGRNLELTLFFCTSLIIAMSLSQDENPEIGSVTYWLLVIPSLVLPFFSGFSILRNSIGPAWPLLAFGITSAFWQGMAGDGRAALQVILLVWVYLWLGCIRARLADRDLVRLYCLLVLLGVYVWLVQGNNPWGMLPLATVSEYAEGGWRVSFAPNIAGSALFSLGMFFVLTRNRTVMRRYRHVLMLVIYFTLLSFVRTALICVALYLFMRWWLGRKPRTRRELFWMPLLLGVGINLIIAASVPALAILQDFDIVSRLFLRSQTGLTFDELFAQLYRPWLWTQHLLLFWNSPALMGLGVFDLAEVQLWELNVGTTPAGNESQLTRLLATFGLPSLLLVYYLVSCLRDLAARQDAWACACFPAVVFLLMQWGAIFHPTDAVGALFLLVVMRGKRAFLGERGSLDDSRVSNTFSVRGV